MASSARNNDRFASDCQVWAIKSQALGRIAVVIAGLLIRAKSPGTAWPPPPRAIEIIWGIFTWWLLLAIPVWFQRFPY
jgi:hypothetical protein